MGFNTNFMDNQSAFAGDLNGINANLMSAEQTQFQAGSTIGNNELNTITKNHVTKGVSRVTLDSCKAALINGKINIAEGIAFFSDGMTMTFDSAGFDLTYTAGSLNYVYLFYDISQNISEPRCTTDLPTTGEYINIAEMSADGVLTDKREYSLNKNPSSLPNAYYTFPAFTQVIPARTGSPYATATKVIDLGGDYRKIYLRTTDSNFNLYFDFDKNAGIYVNKEYYTYGTMGSALTTYLVLNSYNAIYISGLTLENQALTINFSSSSAAEYSFDFVLEVF